MFPIHLESRLPPDITAFIQRVGANTLWLLTARAGTQAVMLLFTMLIARRLGEEGLGAYAFMTSVVFIGNILSTFGTDMFIIRGISGRRDLSSIVPALCVQLLISLGSILLLNLSIGVIPNLPPEMERALRVFNLALIPLSFYSIASAVLRGFERMRTLMFINLSQVILQAGLAWTLISTGDSIVKLAWLLLLTQVITALLASAECLKTVPDVRKSQRTQGLPLVALLVASGPIALISILKVAYQKSSVLMLTALAGPAAAGLFSAALRPVEATQFVHIAIMGALFPVMAQVHGETCAGSWYTDRILRASWRVVLGLGLLISGLLYALSGSLIPLLFGNQFTPSIPALRLLSWSLIPYSVNIYLSSQLLAAGKERTLVSIYLASLALLVGLNAWMIPRLAQTGACLTILVCESFQAAIFLSLSRPPTFPTRPGRPTTWTPRERR